MIVEAYKHPWMPRQSFQPSIHSRKPQKANVETVFCFCAGKMNRASETAESFDYMQAGKESSQAAALAQEYMDKLLDESAPASYLLMLASLAKTTSLPVPIRVCFTLGV